MDDPDPACASAPRPLVRLGGRGTGPSRTARRSLQRPPLAARLAIVRICAHYFAHGAWLAEGALLRDAHRLAGIPGVLIHGRLDLSSPLDTAWALARAWPDAELVVVDDAGHTGSDAMRAQVRGALDRFSSLSD